MPSLLRESEIWGACVCQFRHPRAFTGGWIRTSNLELTKRSLIYKSKSESAQPRYFTL